MDFNSVFGVLLSILLAKVVENAGARYITKINLVFKLVFIALVCCACSESRSWLSFFFKDELLAIYDKAISSIVYRLVLIITIIVLIYIAYRNDFQGQCNFKKLENKITDFTEKASGNQSENSKLYILCGDMDVWGQCDESKEFNQLVNLQRNGHQELDIRILCKHCIEDDYISEIEKDSYVFDPDEFERNVLQIEQIYRIATFRERVLNCSFRFYKKSSDDESHLRARVISNKESSRVLIYRKTERKFGIIMRYFNKKMRKDMDPHVYEYIELTEDGNDTCQKMNYVELCNLKWENCDAVLSEKIVGLCETYVRYQRADKKIKRIAFVYAKTYEVAHYGTSRMEFPPFGVLYLATAVKQYCNKWIPEIIALEENLLLDEEKFITLFSKYDVVAFSIVSVYTVPLFVRAMNIINN